MCIVSNAIAFAVDLNPEAMGNFSAAFSGNDRSAQYLLSGEWLFLQRDAEVFGLCHFKWPERGDVTERFIDDLWPSDQ